jgi:hypothetical protein
MNGERYTYGSKEKTPHIHCYKGGGHLKIYDRKKEKDII